jgi:hypothetical protein
MNVDQTTVHLHDAAGNKPVADAMNGVITRHVMIDEEM